VQITVTLQNMTIHSNGTGSFAACDHHRGAILTTSLMYDHSMRCSSQQKLLCHICLGAKFANYNVFAWEYINNGSAGVYFYGRSTGLHGAMSF
jgi:hypothetical protein